MLETNGDVGVSSDTPHPSHPCLMTYLTYHIMGNFDIQSDGGCQHQSVFKLLVEFSFFSF